MFYLEINSQNLLTVTDHRDEIVGMFKLNEEGCAEAGKLLDRFGQYQYLHSSTLDG